MHHTFYHCPSDCDDPACNYCMGGLAFCTVCKGGEGSLPTECPGTPMGQETERRVYAGEINFRGGAWREESNRNIYRAGEALP